jgi:hypothetical protein
VQPSRTVLLLSLAIAGLAGCATRDRMTADATGCGIMEVKMVDSSFARQGVTTAWCARCRDTLYLCATPPDHSRVACRPSRAGDGCSP